MCVYVCVGGVLHDLLLVLFLGITLTSNTMGEAAFKGGCESARIWDWEGADGSGWLTWEAGS